MSDEHHMNLLSSWDEDLPGMYDHLNPRQRAVPFQSEEDHLRARIAALEAQVARLTAPVTEEEAERTLADLPWCDDFTNADAATALTAFLERRMKG